MRPYFPNAHTGKLSRHHASAAHRRYFKTTVLFSFSKASPAITPGNLPQRLLIIFRRHHASAAQYRDFKPTPLLDKPSVVTMRATYWRLMSGLSRVAPLSSHQHISTSFRVTMRAQLWKSEQRSSFGSSHTLK